MSEERTAEELAELLDIAQVRYDRRLGQCVLVRCVDANLVAIKLRELSDGNEEGSGQPATPPEPGKKPVKLTESAKVAGGKYEFQLYDDDWRVHVLRHGEPWLVIEQGHKAISSLVFEFNEAKKTPEPGELKYCKEHRTIHCSCQQREIDRLKQELAEAKKPPEPGGIYKGNTRRS